MIAAVTLSLLLTKAPPAQLEPAPAQGFNRLHAREMTSSGFLRDNFNRFDQNYLPIYAADDEAGTAWVEGVPGLGAGEWLMFAGPKLDKAEALQIFLRNGLQASKKLFDANARLKQIRLEPVLLEADGKITAAGAPVETELKSAEGWQSVDVPVKGSVSAVRLTILSAYPGTKYEDTCLSDMRVYVKGGDKYLPELEAKAEARIREEIALRKDASPKFASNYEGKKLVELPPAAKDSSFSVRLADFESSTELKDPFARVKKALEAQGDASEREFVPKGWRKVDPSSVPADPGLSMVFSSLSSRSDMVQPGALLDRHSLELKAGENKRAQTEVYALGSLKSPTQVMVRYNMVEVEREDLNHPTYFEMQRYCVVYAGDLADVVIDFRNDVAYALEWKPPVAGQGPSLAGVVSFELSPNSKRAAWQWKVKNS
jgi:hypothetical protein